MSAALISWPAMTATPSYSSVPALVGCGTLTILTKASALPSASLKLPKSLALSVTSVVPLVVTRSSVLVGRVLTVWKSSTVSLLTATLALPAPSTSAPASTSTW